MVFFYNNILQNRNYVFLYACSYLLIFTVGHKSLKLLKAKHRIIGPSENIEYSSETPDPHSPILGNNGLISNPYSTRVANHVSL